MKDSLGADVILHPGDLFFGEAPNVAYTLLGSCVTVTLWHRQRKIGGMCHFLLANRQPGPSVRKQAPGYFAEDAFKYFDHQIQRFQLPASELEVKLFGGGNMFNSTLSNTINVAKNNVEQAQRLIERRGWPLKTASVGGNRYRKVYFDLTTGDVWLSYGRQQEAC